jgi:hypothetical protein
MSVTLLSAAALARSLDVAQETVYRWIRSGTIPPPGYEPDAVTSISDWWSARRRERSARRGASATMPPTETTGGACAEDRAITLPSERVAVPPQLRAWASALRRRAYASDPHGSRPSKGLGGSPPPSDDAP